MLRSLGASLQCWVMFLATFYVVVFGVGLSLATAAPNAAAIPANHAEQMARGQDIFTKQVRGILVERCLKCHGGEKTKGDFDLATRDGLLHGGTGGVDVVPGKSRDSRFYKLITHQEDPHMPAKAAKLTEDQINQISSWIDLGAPYDKPLLEKKATVEKKPMVVTEEDKRFWSFQPLTQPAIPVISHNGWCKTPVDFFILEKLREKGLTPNPTVERAKLIRRAYLDLVGLPPTPKQISDFTKDPHPDAYEKLVDRLLESPHFGERWARHWLDIARFAESHGFEHDYDRPGAYHFRDFVIKAFNQDLPYDKFVQWQIAGDEIEPSEPMAVLATGFLAAGVHSTQITKNQAEKERYDELDDMTRTIGTAMLGLTVGCARCHDHKYDPIPTKDYYRMVSTFTTTVRSEIELNLEPRAFQESMTRFKKEHRKLVKAREIFEETELSNNFRDWARPWQSRLQPAQKAFLAWCFKVSNASWWNLANRVYRHTQKTPVPKVTKALICSEGVPAIRLHTQGEDFLEQTHFLKRGDPNQKEGVAPPGYLQVLMRNSAQVNHWMRSPPAGWHTSYRRRSLAEWLTDVNEGAGNLLARVIVNRLWVHHFGRGLVATPSDFGFQGEKPTNEKLLDWLASELIRHQWHLKPIHKLIMTSAVYREGGMANPKNLQIDSENRFQWRRTPQRLDAEVIRDSLLAVSGSLDETMYGPGTLNENQKRRSIYFFVKRSKLIPMMTLFDAPDGLQSIALRSTTTVAPQALLLMNNSAVRSYAENLAGKVKRVEPLSDQGAVRLAYQTVLGRQPTDEEITRSVDFISLQTGNYKQEKISNAAELSFADFCQVLMSLNEFVYVD